MSAAFSNGQRQLRGPWRRCYRWCDKPSQSSGIGPSRIGAKERNADLTQPAQRYMSRQLLPVLAIVGSLGDAAKLPLTVDPYSSQLEDHAATYALPNDNARELIG